MRGGGRRAVRGLAPQAGRKPRTARAPALVPSSSFPLLPPSSPPSSPLSWPKGGLGSQPRRVWRALSVRSCGPCWPRAIVRMRGSLLARVRAFAGARPLRRRRVVRPGRLCGRRMLSLCLCGAPVRLNRRPGAPGASFFRDSPRFCLKTVTTLLLLLPASRARAAPQLGRPLAHRDPDPKMHRHAAAPTPPARCSPGKQTQLDPIVGAEDNTRTHATHANHMPAP